MLDYTGADALMIGRAAQGRPWIFREIAPLLDHGDASAAADGGRGARGDRRAPRRPLRVLRRGARACASRASTSAGTRSDLAGGDAFRREINAADTAAAQLAAVDRFFDRACRASASASTIARAGATSSTRATRSAGHDDSRYGAGRPLPREKNTAHQRRQRNRQERREIARRIFPQARRRAAARHLRHGDHARRARAASRR